MTIAAQHVRAGLKHLRQSDPVMKQIIRQVGPFTLKPQRDRFLMLSRGIVGQQISTAAAETIFQRLLNLVAPEKLSEQALANHSVETLQAAGISRQKASYLLDLSEKMNRGVINLNTIGRLSDEQVLQHLIQVKGIGPWSAKMFLIFALGRLDVMAGDDLGIRKAIQKGYQLPETPTPGDVLQRAAIWAPYRSIASWYLWRSLELPSS